MKIAITGGAGFIGAQVTKAYLDAGHDVLVIDSLLYGAHQVVDPRARFYQVDIRDGKLRTILQDERPEIVSHHASQKRFAASCEQAMADADVHIRGLLNVLDSCVNASVRKFIFASGGNNLYGRIDAGRLPATEEEALCPESAYDISKVAGEWYVRHYTRQYGLEHTILRYADIYGETNTIHTLQHYHPLNYFISMLARCHAPVIRGTGNEVRDHIFLDDVVQANLCVLKRGENHTIHISSGCGYSLNQLYQIVARLMASPIKPMYLSGPLEEPAPIVLDNTRAQDVLGWQPEMTLTEGVQRAVKCLRTQMEQAVPSGVSVASKSEVVPTVATRAGLKRSARSEEAKIEEPTPVLTGV